MKKKNLEIIAKICKEEKIDLAHHFTLDVKKSEDIVGIGLFTKSDVKALERVATLIHYPVSK